MRETLEYNALAVWAKPQEPATLGHRAWTSIRVVLHNRASFVGLIIIVVMLVLSVGAPMFAPYSPTAIHIQDKVMPPSLKYPLGTDQFGRDVFSRLLYGGRISLFVSFTSVAVATVLGTFIGAVAGFGKRWVDEVLMRLIDIAMAFPYIVLAIALVALVGPSLRNIILVVGVTTAPGIARLTHGSVLAEKETDYVLAARTVGLTDRRILLRHVIPNVLTPIVVFASLSMATAILIESSLSFLGLGIQPPTASWGTMIANGQNYVADGPWMATAPGIAISVTILGFNLLGDGLRDALDPRLRSGRGRTSGGSGEKGAH